MKSIWTMGEILVEIMRPRAGMRLDLPGEFLGPYPSGAPAIFIDTVARLGRPAGVIGGVGDDDFGDCVLSRLEQDGVDCRWIRRYPHLATAVAFVTYFDDGSRKFLYHIDHTPAVMTRFFGGEGDQEPGFFHVMGCSLMTNDTFRDNILQAVKDFANRGARISFDPNIRVELLQGRTLEAVVGPVLEQSAVLLPGEAELALLSGEMDAVRGVQHMFASWPLELIVLKLGRQGCCVYQRNGDAISVPAFVIEEVDPTGAGDCFDAGFLCGLLDGLSLTGSARLAAAVGALNAAAFGPMEGQISREKVGRMVGPD